VGTKNSTSTASPINYYKMENNNLPPLYCWTILYPNREGAFFDFEHYSKTLMPQYVAILGENCVKFEVRKGLAAPGASSPNYVCIASIWLRSRERFRESMADIRMKGLLEKFAAVTDIQSIRQMDEVIA
jgi:uncharacterized protein (TIGR02118 family)